MKKNRKIITVVVYVAVLVLFFSWMLGAFGLGADKVPYSKVVELFKNEQVRSFTVEDGTLYIINDSNRKWYDHIGIQIGSPKITVRLPQKQYAALTVKAATGNVSAEGGLRVGAVEMRLTTGSISLTDLNASSLLLQTNTGKVDLSRVTCTETVGTVVGTGTIHGKDITCRELVATGGTGDIILVNVLAGMRLTVTGGTSDVEFIACDARDINVSTATGNVQGTLRSGKTFDAESGTGKVRVPANGGSGSCYIRSKTGDIHITVE